jgi:hypothetical protein
MMTWQTATSLVNHQWRGLYLYPLMFLAFLIGAVITGTMLLMMMMMMMMMMVMVRVMVMMMMMMMMMDDDDDG